MCFRTACLANVSYNTDAFMVAGIAYVHADAGSSGFSQGLEAGWHDAFMQENTSKP